MGSPLTTYTEQGQRILDLAKAEARALDHHYIGVEHLLLGLLVDGSATKSLTEQGVTPDLIRAALVAMLGTEESEPDPNAEFPFTPHSLQLLATAGETAYQRGEPAIEPSHILDAILQEKDGLTIGLLQSVGVVLDRPQQAKKHSPEEDERFILRIEEDIARRPRLSEEEELQLAHLVARGEAEKRRAKYLKEAPNDSIVDEGQNAYFKLISANYHLVFSVAKEYFGPERDIEQIMDAGSGGLSIAAIRFGLKKQTSFQTYAAHWIHLKIMDALE